MWMRISLKMTDRRHMLMKQEVGCGGGVLPCDADLLCAKGHPNVFFGRVIDWQMSAWMQGISILQSTYTLSGAEICSSVGWTVNARGTD